MKSFFFALILALIATLVAANPVPQGTPNNGPTGTPPNDATGSITYANNGGSAYVPVYGTYTDIPSQCRGLAGLAITYLVEYTKYPGGRPAYGFQFYGDYGCKGAPLNDPIGFFYNNGKSYKDANGNVIVPLSMRYVPL